MPTPVLHLLVGPNGAGKTTLFERVIGPVTGLEFVNADRIAKERWPGAEAESAYEAARLAADRRSELIAARGSFATETVFSHPSKLDILKSAGATGYRTYLHVVAVPKELAVARVRLRAVYGGHDVPSEKVEARYDRLWPLVARAIELADESVVYDNTRGEDSFAVLARYAGGRPAHAVDWPAWAPEALRQTKA